MRSKCQTSLSAPAAGSGTTGAPSAQLQGPLIHRGPATPSLTPRRGRRARLPGPRSVRCGPLRRLSGGRLRPPSRSVGVPGRHPLDTPTGPRCATSWPTTRRRLWHIRSPAHPDGARHRRSRPPVRGRRIRHNPQRPPASPILPLWGFHLGNARAGGLPRRGAYPSGPVSSRGRRAGHGGSAPGTPAWGIRAPQPEPGRLHPSPECRRPRRARLAPAIAPLGQPGPARPTSAVGAAHLPRAGGIHSLAAPPPLWVLPPASSRSAPGVWHTPPPPGRRSPYPLRARTPAPPCPRHRSCLGALAYPHPSRRGPSSLCPSPPGGLRGPGTPPFPRPHAPGDSASPVPPPPFLPGRRAARAALHAAPPSPAASGLSPGPPPPTRPGAAVPDGQVWPHRWSGPRDVGSPVVLQPGGGCRRASGSALSPWARPLPDRAPQRRSFPRAAHCPAGLDPDRSRALPRLDLSPPSEPLPRLAGRAGGGSRDRGTVGRRCLETATCWPSWPWLWAGVGIDPAWRGSQGWRRPGDSPLSSSPWWRSPWAVCSRLSLSTPPAMGPRCSRSRASRRRLLSNIWKDIGETGAILGGAGSSSPRSSRLIQRAASRS